MHRRRGYTLLHGYTCMGKCGMACGGAGYGLGFLGAAIYFIQASHGFWWGVLGFLKAVVWPVFFVYEVLRHVGA